MKNEPTTKAKRKYARLAPAVWAEIRAHWETGEPTLEDLAAQYSVTTRALQSHFAKHKSVKGSKAKAIAASVQEAVFVERFDDQDKRVLKGREARWIAVANAEKIETAIMGQVEQAQKDPASVVRASAMIKMLNLASQGLDRMHALKWAAMGLDRIDQTDEMPELRIVDLAEEDLKRIHAGHGVGGDDDLDDGAPPTSPSLDDPEDDDSEIVTTEGEPKK
jgi:hypothetical protein